MKWLVEQNALNAMEQAQALGFVPTAEQTEQFAATRFAAEGDTSRVLVTAGNSAEIKIDGVLTQSPDIMAMLFGGGNTTYPEIIAALAEADRDDAVENITLKVGTSPGGSITGLFEAVAALQTTKKPIQAVVSGMAASATYALVSQAESITALNKATMFGSVGIVAEFNVSENRVSITSRDAPKKRPDVTTPEGVAMVEDELDAVHELFVEDMAAGRGTTVEKVNAEFGQGATVLARDALKKGMIDKVEGSAPAAVKSTKSTTAQSGTQPEATKMDLNQLKIEHPEVFAAAVQIGTTQEHDRVNAHLTMGNASGDMKTAIAAIEDGSSMTATLQATYMAAGMNRADIQARGNESAVPGAGDMTDQSEADAGAEAGANILTAAAAKCGVELKG